MALVCRIIVTLPGSSKAVAENLEAVMHVLPHAVQLMASDVRISPQTLVTSVDSVALEAIACVTYVAFYVQGRT